MSKVDQPPPSRRSTRVASKLASPSTVKPVVESRSTSAKRVANDESKPSKKAKTDEAEKDEPAPPKPVSRSTPSTSKGQLKLGDVLPSITLQDHTGALVDVGKLTESGKGVVIFLYPRANTPGCTNQACGFRDAFNEIQQLGYDVFGLSTDKPTAQQNWIDKHKLTYRLLCDPESKLIKKLGAFVLPKNTKRSHFIFEKGTGKLVDAQLGVKPADDPGNCLKFIKKHHA